jgi:phosphotransferase system HPr-like phosphotransfer protein
MMVLYVAIPLSAAIRIWLRIRVCGYQELQAKPASSVVDGIAIFQDACSCVIGILSIASLSLLQMRSQQPVAAVGWVAFVTMLIVMIWAFAATIVKVRVYSLRKRNSDGICAHVPVQSDESRPRPMFGAGLCLFILVAIWTWSAWREFAHGPSATPYLAVDVIRTCSSWAISPPLALLCLVWTIRLLSRLRVNVAGIVWWCFATTAVLFAMVNLVLVASWLRPWTTEYQDADVRLARTAIMQHDTSALRGAVAMSELRKALAHADRDVRLQAARACDDLGPDAKDAIAELRKALADGDHEVRTMVAHALSCVGAEAKEAIPELRNALSDEDSQVRSMAAYALSSLGPAGKRAVPELRRSLGDEDRGVRSMASYALSRMGREIKDAIPELRKALGDEDKDVRWHASWALYVLGPEAEEALPELRKAMNDPDSGVRSNAASAVDRIAPANSRQ